MQAALQQTCMVSHSTAGLEGGILTGLLQCNEHLGTNQTNQLQLRV